MQRLTQASLERLIGLAFRTVGSAAGLTEAAGHYAVAHALPFGLGKREISDTMAEMSELEMVELQSLVSQRAQLMAMITNLTKALDEAQRAIIGNLR